MSVRDLSEVELENIRDFLRLDDWDHIPDEVEEQWVELCQRLLWRIDKLQKTIDRMRYNDFDGSGQ